MEENYSKLVDIAYNMHVSGKFEEAKDVYEKLLSINPDDLDVKNLYAQLNVSLKNYDKAIELFSQVYEKTQIDEILLNIAKVYFNIQDYQNAIKSINKMKELDISALRILGMAYKNNKNFNEAINTFLKIYLNSNHDTSDLLNLSVSYKSIEDYENSLKYGLIAFEADNKNVNVNLHLASVYATIQDNENELKHLLNVFNVQPNIQIAYRIGILYRLLNNDEKALEYFNIILNADPDNKKALQNIAIIYLNHDKKVSVQIYNQILEKNPTDEESLVQLYILYVQMFDDESAYKVAQRLIEINPNNIDYEIFAAERLINFGKFNEALEIYQKAKKIKPEEKNISRQIAYIYSNIGRGKEAIDIYKESIDPDGINQDLVFTCLREKRLHEVKEFLYRHLNSPKTKEQREERKNTFIYKLGLEKNYKINEDVLKDVAYKPSETDIKIENYRKKAWHFDDITGKRVLIYSGNGVGDTIMFTRYLPKVMEIASEVLLEVPPSCIELYKYNFPNLKIYDTKNPPDESEYDYTSSFFSLLANLDIDLTQIDPAPYLKIQDELVKEKSQIECLKTEKKKVGIYWQGNPMILQNRSIRLDKLAPIFDLKNIQYYSFQVSNFDTESTLLKTDMPIIDIVPYIHNYSDTAALLKNIDVLISIDTSIANLAGAMGIKTFLLLPYNTEWRWFYDNDKTPWYDSVRIFRQTKPNVWDDVVERVKNALEL